jgi:enoyl-CoA hydratase/carnithine racemase
MGKIDVERRGAVALVTLRNPARRNALTLEMREALLAPTSVPWEGATWPARGCA